MDSSFSMDKARIHCQTRERILKEVLEVAGGKVTKAEALGFSDIAVDHVCRYI